jgi:hypothetical protein
MLAVSVMLAALVFAARAPSKANGIADDRGAPQHAISLDDAGPATSPLSEPDEASASQPANDLCEPLQAAISAGTDPAANAQACLNAAHCILVRQSAVPLSAELTGSTDSRRLLAGLCGTGLSLLNRADASLAEGQIDAEVAAQLKDRIDLLRAFGGLFDAIARSDSTDDSAKRILAACKKLAVYLDDSNEGVVESAKLWQGVAYRRAGRPDRSLQVLRPIITAPVSRRIGFLARIERCRALGETGHYAAGLSLGYRLGARVNAWFAEEDEATRKQAAGTVHFVAAELFRGWAAKLRASGEETAADQAASEAGKLTDSDSAPSPELWLGLDASIAGISDWGDQPTSEAAEEPDAEP